MKALDPAPLARNPHAPAPMPRREFMRLLGLGLLTTPLLLQGIEGALAASETAQPLVWFIGQGPGLHGAVRYLTPEFRDFFTQNFAFYGLGREMPDPERLHNHILLLEGQFSLDPRDRHSSQLKELTTKARVVVLVGNEASNANQVSEGYLDLERGFLFPGEVPFIRLPGEPVQGFQLLALLNHLLVYGLPQLDEYRRPDLFFSTPVCDHCHLRKDLEKGLFANALGDAGCLLLQGCKGPVTKNTCARLGWNEENNWCVAAGQPCVGCSNPDFPLAYGLGRYGQIQGAKDMANSDGVNALETIGMGALGLTTAGILTHALSRQGLNLKQFSGNSSGKGESEEDSSKEQVD